MNNEKNTISFHFLKILVWNPTGFNSNIKTNCSCYFDSSRRDMFVCILMY